MKTLTKFVSGLTASLLLTAGLHAAAEKLDPMSQDSALGKPDNKSDDHGKVSGLPCMPCQGDDLN